MAESSLSSPSRRTMKSKRSSMDAECEAKPNKRKKRTYYVRKEELVQLKEELRKLEGRNPDLVKYLEVLNVVRQNEAFRDAIQSQRLRLAVGHSMLSQYMVRCALMDLEWAAVTTDDASRCICIQRMSDASFEPLIKLDRNPMNRHATLCAMKHQILQHAHAFLEAQMSHMDDLVDFNEGQKFTNQHGDRCFRAFDVTTLPLRHASVEGVFHELRNFATSFEMSISEVQGGFTIRESEDSRDPSISQHRIVTFVDDQEAIESNHVMFSQLLQTNDSSSDQGIGIITSHFVSEDAVYPYWPDKFLRQDVTMYTMVRRVKQAYGVAENTPDHRLTISETEDSPARDGEESIVVVRWALSRVRPSNLPLVTDVHHRLLEGIRKIDVAIVDRLQAFIDSHSPRSALPSQQLQSTVLSL